ncbi:MICOS complex subunit Mic60-like [Hyposmocoma kahamanoa]|uniref:MICOS complex subunit Mic60-like n=1 Tax=Hyposmocoma kahamanoa TaxID=1477025 RepID=UPI000E6D5AEF|nr:MICOS complex subunit Mic60-like [Hyposmocoma kahamanoa]
MLKISNHLANSSLVLVRKQLGDGSTAAALILMRTPRRRYALGSESQFKETCPPPPPRKQSRRLLFTAIGATILTGSAIVYAKHSPETRNWLETNAPWAHNVVAIVYQENETYWDFTSKQFSKIYTSISDFMFGKVIYKAQFQHSRFEIVEIPYDSKDSRLFLQLKTAQTSRDQHIKLAKEACVKGSRAIETLDRMITQGTLKAPPENLAITKRYIKQFREDLNAASEALRIELEKGDVSEKFWSKVEDARSAYKEELQSLFPGIDLTANKLKAGGDLDMLLVYTLKQVQFLQNELVRLSTVAEQKIARAVECNDDKLIIEAKAEQLAREERIKMEFEYLKKTLKLEAENSRKYKEQLAKQYEMQEEITRSRLEKKEKEIMGRLNRAVSEQVEKERVKFKKELAAMAGKLQAIEQTLKKRAAAEQDSRRSQSVWAAAEGLLAATRRPGLQTNIDNELRALEKAGQGDKMVQAVLMGIPKATREEGIATEVALKDRFDVLEKTAMKVALIGRDGASLPMYFLSWVQSKLLFQKLAEIPRDELDNLPQDFSKLDTFDIMQRARYYMDRGNLSAALRYVNLLQGAPRAAALCWVEDARRHLEIRQAAETVMAHASLASINSKQ